MKHPLTHTGWALFCPVYMSAPDSWGDFSVEPRREWLRWLFDFALWADGGRIFVMSVLRPDVEPGFMFWCTGPRKTPT